MPEATHTWRIDSMTSGACVASSAIEYTCTSCTPFQSHGNPLSCKESLQLRAAVASSMLAVL